MQAQAPWEGYAKRVQQDNAPHVTPAQPASVQAVPSAWESLVIPFQFLLCNPDFMQLLVSIPALPPILPLPGTFPAGPLSPHQRLMRRLPRCIATCQHLPLTSTSRSAGILCLSSFPVVYDLSLFPAPDAGVQAWNPQLLNVVSLHRTALQKPTAHARVRSGHGRAQ